MGHSVARKTSANAARSGFVLSEWVVPAVSNSENSSRGEAGNVEAGDGSSAPVDRALFPIGVRSSMATSVRDTENIAFSGNRRGQRIRFESFAVQFVRETHPFGIL